MGKTLKKMAICLIVSMLLPVWGGYAQTPVCSGTVVDNTGEAVIGASVLIKGAPLSTGAVTDLDGYFVQENAKPGDVLVVSCIGFESVEVTWNGSPLQVVLGDDSTLLEETVITAYGGKQLRSKLTNSITSVKSETITSGMHAQAAASLAGAVAGLSVSQTSGSPYAEPTIILRGGTEMDGTGSPLVIVDGAQRSMSDINPNDIESIEVLKDAGATAIYGARAANGVILVTTKRGTEGTSQIAAHAKTSWSFFHSQYDFLNSEDYLYWMRLAYKNSPWASASTLNGMQPYGTGNIYFDANGNVADGLTNSGALWGVLEYSDDLAFLLNSKDWGVMKDPADYVDRIIFWKGATAKDINIKSPAFSQDYSVDFSGGNNKGNYYASLGYNRSEGNARDNSYDRLTFVFNGDYKIRPWLSSSSSFNFSHTNRTPIKNGNSEANYFARALTLPPTMRVYNSWGEYNASPRNGITDSPIGHVNDKIDYQDQYDKFNMTQAFTITFTPWLNLRLSGSWFYQDRNYEYFAHDYQRGPNLWVTTRLSRDYYSRNLNQTYQAVLNFNKQFGLHGVSAMAGTEYVDQATFGFNAYGQGAPTDEFQDLEYTSTDEGLREIDSWHSDTRVLSFFGKADYDYDGKYLLSAVIRQDGYSRLAKSSRWGIFPGVSAGWVFTKEPFMNPFRDILSFGKFRISYGANGVIPSTISAYTVQGAYAAGTNYNGNGSTYMSTLPMESLLWEKSWTFETGLDVSFFQNRLNINTSYYNRHTKDKIASITIPSHTGRTGLTSNLGEIQNQGFEFEISARIVNTRDWKVNFGLNGAYNRNKVLRLPDNENENNRNGGFQVYVPGSYDPATGQSELIWVGGYQEGQTPGDIYSFKYGGIYQNWDEIYEKAGWLIDQSSGNNQSNSKVLYGPYAWEKATEDERNNGFQIVPGDAIFEDVNGDGIIDNYDKVKIGNRFPKWTGGFNASVSWKGLTLSGRFDYALNYKVIDHSTPWIMGNMQGTFNTISIVKDTWVMTDENTGAGHGKYPRYDWADQLGHRNYARTENPIFIYEGSYLSFREVTLSYSLPKSLIQKIKLDDVNVFVTGQNLGYLTKAGLLASPEFSYSSYYGNNTAWGGYPLPRILMLGANVKF